MSIRRWYTTRMDLATTTRVLKTESGRIVVAPILASGLTSMSDFCMVEPIDPGKLWVYVRVGNHPKKVKKHRVRSIVISKTKAPKASSKVESISPMLFIGDATFLYIDRRKSDEYERAVYCCKNESSMSGAYRTNDGQVAAGIRLGDKECELHIECRKDSAGNVVEIEITPVFQ